VWIYTGNKLAKFHGNILSLSENIAKSCRGATFFDSHCIKEEERRHTVYVLNQRELYDHPGEYS